MKSITLEVLAPMLSNTELGSHGPGFILDYVGLRSKDRKASTDGYPDDWKLAVDYLSSWLEEISNLYRHRIKIRVIDAQTPLGFWKQIRHRLFRFPAFIVDRKHTYIGWDYKELEALIDHSIHSS